MDMTTAFSFALFLIASFGLAWAGFMSFAKLTTAIVLSSRKAMFTVSFYPQVWTGCACFTYIMGYIFIF